MANIIDFKIGPVDTTAAIAVPSGAGPFPGVVVGFHRGGIDSFTLWVVDEMAKHGFVAIAPNHFHVLPPGKGPEDRKDYLTDEQLGLDLRAAAAWLASQINVAGKKFGLLGHCMGGRTTLLGLVDSPELWTCGCVWYGGGAHRAQGTKLPPPTERLAAVQAPVAGFFGNLDTNPSPEDVNKIDEILTRLKKPHDFHRYDNTPHGFMNPASSHYREHASSHSWTVALKLLREQAAALN